MTRKLQSRGHGWWVFAEAMKSREAFEASALTGKPEESVSSWGRLSRADDFGSILAAAERAGTLHYVVYSYATPIAAVVGPTLWLVTNESYSQTTAKHLSKIATAADRLNREALEMAK